MTFFWFASPRRVLLTAPAKFMLLVFRAQKSFYASHKQRNRAQKTLRRVENEGEFDMMNE